MLFSTLAQRPKTFASDSRQYIREDSRDELTSKWENLASDLELSVPGQPGSTRINRTMPPMPRVLSHHQ